MLSFLTLLAAPTEIIFVYILQILQKEKVVKLLSSGTVGYSKAKEHLGISTF